MYLESRSPDLSGWSYIFFTYLYPVLLHRFSKHIATTFPELKDKKLLIAISGGLDSVVLTEMLHQLEYNISLAHCNFQLRNMDSNQDEMFVNAMANRLQRTIYTKKFDTKSYAQQQKLSIQLAARDLRYNWFLTVLENNKLDYLLTAHHADDNLETFLINLSRGTGLDGLISIPEKNNNCIRPLLPFSRDQIEQYAKDNHLTWREDASNAETKYVRNKLRHDIIPVLKTINPQLLDVFSTTIQHLKETQQIVQESVENVKQKVVISDKNGIIELDIQALKILKYTKAYLYQLLNEFNFTAWNDINDLIDAQSGKIVYSNTHRIIKHRDSLLVTPLPNEEYKSYIINEVGEHHFQEFSLKISKFTGNHEFLTEQILASEEDDKGRLLIDSSKLNFPLTLRKPQTGDYFYPFGMKGKKKLSKFFKDEKLSLLQKENVWVLISNNEIVWVINYRLDDRFKITDDTETILKFTYTNI